jgi:hypothetical protein
MRSAGGKGFGVQCREAMSGFGHWQSVLPVKLSRLGSCEKTWLIQPFLTFWTESRTKPTSFPHKPKIAFRREVSD